MVDIDVHELSHLKKELAWAVDKHLWVISIIMLFKNKSTKELKGTNNNAAFNLNIILHLFAAYVALSNGF